MELHIRAHIRQRSATEEQQSQPAFSAKTLRAAGLLSAACVESAVTARCGDAPASPPWPRPKSLTAGPHAILKQALRYRIQGQGQSPSQTGAPASSPQLRSKRGGRAKGPPSGSPGQREAFGSLSWRRSAHYARMQPSRMNSLTMSKGRRTRTSEGIFSARAVVFSQPVNGSSLSRSCRASSTSGRIGYFLIDASF